MRSKLKIQKFSRKNLKPKVAGIKSLFLLSQCVLIKQMRHCRGPHKRSPAWASQAWPPAKAFYSTRHLGIFFVGALARIMAHFVAVIALNGLGGVLGAVSCDVPLLIALMARDVFHVSPASTTNATATTAASTSARRTSALYTLVLTITSQMA